VLGGMGVLGHAASWGLAAMVHPHIFRVRAWQFLLRSHGFTHVLGRALEFGRTVNASASPVLGPELGCLSASQSPVFTFPVLLACYTLSLTLGRACL